MSVRFLESPLAAAKVGDLRAAAEAQAGRKRDGALSSALIADGDAMPNVPALLADGALAVTTGQQAGLFTGPLYAILKALSAAALAREWSVGGPPVGPRKMVPVFWVAGDDHDFAEIDHCIVLGQDGKPARVTLRERAPDAPMLPAYREMIGADGAVALSKL